MAAPRVWGEQPLPGEPEKLLKATKKGPSATNGYTEYLGVSAATREDGSVVVHAVRLDPYTRRVVPEHLDTIEPGFARAFSLAQFISHWAQELDERSRTR